MTTRTCADCGARLPPREGPGRPALYCRPCKAVRVKARKLARARHRYAADPEYRARRLAAAKRPGGGQTSISLPGERRDRGKRVLER